MFLFDDIVAKHDGNFVPIGKKFGQTQGRGNTALAFLVGVVEVPQTEVLPVTQQTQKIACVVPRP